jgi:von Willebrand factor type A domain
MILSVFISFVFSCPSQTNISRPAPGRYLLVLETSRSMNHRSEGNIKTLANILFSGIAGQIQQGDTIGVWTYNKDLYTGRLPLQRWSKLEQRETCSTILNFIKTQKYENQPTFSAIRPALEKVTKDSESLTVILVSSGEEKMLGTPFDDQINQLYNNWREEQQKARMPFVTVLRAKRGAIVGYSVTPSPWQVEMPAWPAQPIVKAVELPRPPAKAQPSAVPPLIFTGKKSKPVETTNSTEVAPAIPAHADVPVTNPLPKVTPSGLKESASPESTIKQPVVSDPKVEAPQATLPHSPDPSVTITKESLVSGAANQSDTALSLANASNGSNSIAATTAEKSNPRPPEVSTGVTASGNALLSSKILWLGGLGLFGLACGVLVALNRRPRPQPISLITHSLAREKK